MHDLEVIQQALAIADKREKRRIVSLRDARRL
jgi:hypothetical protein